MRSDAFFREMYGTLVAVLVRQLGVASLPLIEDAAQQALLAAVEQWPRQGAPQNPEGWLYTVARRAALDTLRTQSRRARLLNAAALDDGVSEADRSAARLSLMFLCCDEAWPLDARVALTLKVVCGFDVQEIAERLFTKPDTIQKRLSRARTRLRATDVDAAAMNAAWQKARVPAVRTVLYVLFTEGHLSIDGETAVRAALCEEALRLAQELSDSAVGDEPQTDALLALMHLQLARMAARQDAGGGLVPLNEQDRTRYDVHHISQGLACLARAARGEVFSRFHAEAGIAAEHCLAPTFNETRWDRIVECYAQLDAIAPSPLHTLNRALALAEWRGPEAALSLVQAYAAPPWLEGTWYFASVLADLHRRCGHIAEAMPFAKRALNDAPSPQIREALRRRLQS